MVNMEYTKDLSIVISLYNEDESLPELINWIERVTSEQGYNYELILVDDGSTDSSWNVIKQHSEKNSAIRGISFRRNYGKSAASRTVSGGGRLRTRRRNRFRRMRWYARG